MRKSAVYRKAFSELGDSENITQELEETMESFVCSIYGGGKITSVNELRYNKLVKKSNKLRSSDPSSLPPCKETLRPKLKRCNHVSNMWKQAVDKNMVLWDATRNGYVNDNNKYKPLWFEGPEKPDVTYTPTAELLDSDDNSDSDTDSESESDSDMDQNSYCRLIQVERLVLAFPFRMLLVYYGSSIQ